jgi:hypothetical protein
MSNRNVLCCDLCPEEKVRFAVGSRSLHDERGKVIAELDLCETHLKQIDRVFTHPATRPSDGAVVFSGKAPRGKSLKDHILNVTEYAVKHTKPFSMKDIMAALQVPQSGYSTLARAVWTLKKNGTLKVEGGGVHSRYSLRGIIHRNHKGKGKPVRIINRGKGKLGEPVVEIELEPGRPEKTVDRL